MSEKVTIYDIDNPYYLYEDIDAVLNEIGELYTVKFKKESKTEYYPKTVVSKSQNWAGNECKSAFNKLIPKVKSLTKDMYSIIEGVIKSRRGEFKNWN